jgi:UDP-GlcNAc:undecaprenyl-phosphate/decaprenyl-phosphate GlcNAc-1-phosphate transferase
MLDALTNFLCSALICFGLIKMLLPVSSRLGLLDKPDERKQHEAPTPPIGGFGVFLGILLPYLYVAGLSQEFIGFALGAFLLVLIGALDDKYHIDWKTRIAIQALAALSLIYISGVRAEHVGPLFGFGDIELGWLSVPFTVFVTLGLINAMNMFDGIDGLVGMVCSAVTVMFICAALYSGAYDVALGLFWVLGAMAGFLWFNFRRPGQPVARVFLGDAGSGFIGFLMAFIIFRLTQNADHPVSPILGPYLLAPPIIDCLVLIVHRIRRGKSPFAAGRDHAHHLMLDAGFTVNQIVSFIVLLTCITGLFGALAMYFDVPEPMMVMWYLFALFSWLWITETEQRAKAYFQWVHKKIYA